MKRLLIAEDEEILRMLLVETVSDSFDVTEAADGNQALTLLNEGSFDIVVIDYMMPYKTGLEVVENLSFDQKQIPIVMLTAKSQTEDKQRAMNAGVTHYVTKPFSPEELLKLLQSIT